MRRKAFRQLWYRYLLVSMRFDSEIIRFGVEKVPLFSEGELQPVWHNRLLVSRRVLCTMPLLMDCIASLFDVVACIRKEFDLILHSAHCFPLDTCYLDDKYDVNCYYYCWSPLYGVWCDRAEFLTNRSHK